MTTLPDLEPAALQSQALDAAMDEAIVWCWRRDACPSRFLLMSKAILAYLSAARSVPEAGKAVVKPLEWKRAAGATVTALAPWGTYAISDGHIELRLNGKLLGYHETLDSAKLAAQADFERRILSAIASVPAPSGASE